MSVQYNRVPRSRDATVCITIVFGQDDPGELLPLVKLTNLFITILVCIFFRDSDIFLAHLRNQSPVVLVANVLINALLNVKSLAESLVSHHPVILGSHSAIVLEYITLISDNRLAIFRVNLLHVLYLGGCATEIYVASDGVFLTDFEGIDNHAPPYDQVRDGKCIFARRRIAFQGEAIL